MAAPLVIGLDVGGTKILAGLVDRTLRTVPAELGALGETGAVPPGARSSPRCGVLSRPNTSSIGAPCVLASWRRAALRRRGPFRQALLGADAGLVDLEALEGFR